MKTSNTKARLGFSLMEIMIALAILALIAGAAIPAMVYMRKRAAITAVHEYVTNCATILTGYKDHYGTVPVTENLSATDITAQQGTNITLAAAGNELRLEMILAASEPGFKWFETGLAEENSVEPPTQSVSFDLATKKFNGTASVTAGSYATFPRLECTRATALSQYNLTGSGALPLGTKVVELIIPGVDASTARNLIRKFNKQMWDETKTFASQTAEETAISAVNGVVKVGAFDATTHRADVRIYVGQF